MAIKIEMLRCFREVARSGNLTDAAQVLKRTPSAVSMMLKQFESHLGEPLFETDRKNKLTALGVFVLEQAERELLHFDNTVRVIESYANASHGHVRIATVPSVAGTIMPRVFSRHMGSYDKVSIEMRDMDSKSILHELSRGRIDIGIATLQRPAAGLDVQLLMTDRYGVVCAPRHPLAQVAGPVAWPALDGVRLIANSLSEGIAHEASRALHDAAPFSAHNLTSLMGMVRANLGVTILPEMAVASTGPTDLRFRPLADDTATREIHLLRRTGSALSPAARTLERDILETVQSMAESAAPGP